MIDTGLGWRGTPPPTLTKPEFAIADNLHLLSEKRERIDEVLAKLDSIRKNTDGSGADRYPSLKDIPLKDIGTGTFDVLKTREELEPYLHDHVKKIAEKGELYLCQTMAPRQLETAHLGVTWLAPHVDPTQPGMNTGSLDDQKLLRVLWRFSPPESGDLHPAPPKMVDGRLIAVWRASTEKECSPKLRRKFERMQARVADRLDGNKYALERNPIKRVVGGLKWRYQSMLRGGREGIANPRGMGRIVAVVLLMSVPTSIGIYAVVYGVQYHAVKHELCQIRTENAKAAASGALPSPASPAVSPPNPGSLQSKQGSGSPPPSGPPPPYSAAAPPYAAAPPSGSPPPYTTAVPPYAAAPPYPAPPPPYSIAPPAYPIAPAYANSSGNGSLSLSA